MMKNVFVTMAHAMQRNFSLMAVTAVAAMVGGGLAGCTSTPHQFTDDQVRESLKDGLAMSFEARALVESNARGKRLLNRGWVSPAVTENIRSITIAQSNGEITITGSSRANSIVLQLNPVAYQSMGSKPLVSGARGFEYIEAEIFWVCAASGYDNLKQLPEECRPDVTDVVSTNISSDQVRKALQEELISASYDKALVESHAAQVGSYGVGQWSNSVIPANAASIRTSRSGSIFIHGGPRADNIALMLTPFVDNLPLSSYWRYAMARPWLATKNEHEKIIAPLGSIRWVCTATSDVYSSSLPEECQTAWGMRSYLLESFRLAAPAKALVESNAAKGYVLNRGWQGITPNKEVASIEVGGTDGKIYITGTAKIGYVVLVLTPVMDKEDPYSSGLTAGSRVSLGRINWVCASSSYSNFSEVLPQECDMVAVESAPPPTDDEIRKVLTEGLFLAKPTQALVENNATQGKELDTGWARTVATAKVPSISIGRLTGQINITAMQGAQNVVLALTPRLDLGNGRFEHMDRRTGLTYPALEQGGSIVWSCSGVSYTHINQLPEQCRP